MSKFDLQPGDVVRRVDKLGGSPNIPMDIPLTVQENCGGMIYVDGYIGGLYSHRFELDRVETSKKVLESAGYTVTPPKPKLKGKLWILKNKFGQVWPSTCNSSASEVKTIAIVEWEEGQGLE